MAEPEFLRNNQKCYARVMCDSSMMQSYEYQMCQHNTISSFLRFQNRNVNGIQYLYFETSGMQSMDIFLQTRKFKQDFGEIFVKSVIKLCEELEEFALRIECVNLDPKYVMVSSDGTELRFMYSFQSSENKFAELEKLLEGCIECLDYKDEIWVERFYRVYEHLLEQGDNFFLLEEMQQLLKGFQSEAKEIIAEEIQIEAFEEQSVILPKQSFVAKRENKKLRKGILVLLLLDIIMLLCWKPLNILKLFLGSAIGLVLLGLGIYLWKQDKLLMHKQEERAKGEEYLEEYVDLAKREKHAGDATQLLYSEDEGGVLYNLQKGEPQYIYINVNGSIIGKDKERAQIHIEDESVSRIHAYVVKEGKECFVEDLNSTNGTRINGEAVKPRVRCLLKQGDKVCFAGAEYIFR